MSNQKKMLSMQRIFHPSQYRSNGLSTLTKENFSKVMVESINKAINTHESAVKEKHVRKLLIGSFQAESGSFFWHHLPVIRLKENQIFCWKFCHVLHKMLRDGHRNVLPSCFERRQILLDCGNMWRHVEDGYGQLIYKYCTLLFNRINFLVNNPLFPNDLKVTNEQLDEIGERDVSVFFDLSCEIFDALDDILRLQELVLMSVDLKKHNSMTATGQCHLAPMIACIQDSSLLYDYSVKILFKLHGALPTSTLEGHRDRFLCQHKALKNFYINASNLQYFKTLIQIPHLSERPPNFLVASELHQHVTPQVVMISSPERESPDDGASHAGPSQMLVNITEDIRPAREESDASESIAQSSYSIDSSIDAILDQPDAHYQMKPSHFGESGDNKDHHSSARVLELEQVISSLKSELEAEKQSHSSTRETLIREIETAKSERDEQVQAKETELKKLRNELSITKQQLKSSNGVLDQVRDDCKRAQHDNEISQTAMKKLVKDLSDLKRANATSSETKVFPANKADEKALEELRNELKQLKLQVSEHEQQERLWSQEKNALVSTKIRLEHQLDTQQEDLLVAEMNETDKIIKEATRRIEELSEKSRKQETGIKLEVNEKISEVCFGLMKSVRNLIIQSRLLQREIVGDSDPVNAQNFYKQNSSWTEGLISAANVVAMAARSLVDSADRTMSGCARFSELAAAAREVAAATTQLVVASRVKADTNSEKLKILTSAAKQVSQCTGNVVNTARVCGELLEQEMDKVDITTLSLHQTKKLEMETQAKLLELEHRLSKERIKLGMLRRQHYEQEDAQTAAEHPN